MAMVRQDVEERADQVEVLASDIRDLEDGANAPRYELGGSVDAAFAVGDEDGDLVRTGRLENPPQLRDCLLEDVRWAYVDLGDDDHHWHVEREGDTEVLFAHANEPVVRSDHQQAVVRARREHPEHRGTQISLVPRQVSEGYHLRRALSDLLPRQAATGNV
ncbi:hypothetical protein V491_04625 [Pseudogymnoascus sp. VKM F-3775]|nr:hypothetical protein V491_04625 [Pseudogymnoascus sp. VKM F-3775]